MRFPRLQASFKLFDLPVWLRGARCTMHDAYCKEMNVVSGGLWSEREHRCKREGEGEKGLITSFPVLFWDV